MSTNENEQASTSSLRIAYQETCSSIRAYTNLEFAQMTIYVAIAGGLLLGWLSESAATANAFIALVGILIGLFFWLMSRRVSEYWDEFVKRACSIEEPLGLYLYRKGAPEKKLWTNRRSLSAVYWTLILSFAVLLLISLSPAWIELRSLICASAT